MVPFLEFSWVGGNQILYKENASSPVANDLHVANGLSTANGL